MSLTLAILEVINLFEKCVPLPISVDIKQNCIIDSHHYKNKYFKCFLYANTWIAVFILLPFFVCRLIWLISHWKSYTAYNTIEAVIYALCLFILIIVLAVFYTFTKEKATIKYIINQRCQIVPEPNYGNQKLLRIPFFRKITLHQAIIYASATVSLLTPPALLVGPFTFPFCPLQIIFGTSALVKISAVVYYSLLVTYGVLLSFSLIMLSVSMIEGVILYSTTIYNNFSSDNLKQEHLRWKKCLNRFHVICIFIKTTDEIFGIFHTILIIVGILLASCGGYMILMMFEKVPLILYVGAFAITFVCFFIAITLTLFAQIPYKNAVKYKGYWKSMLKRKEDKIMLTSCRQIGFSDLIYGLYTAKLGLCICDDIVHNTVNLVLLNG